MYALVILAAISVVITARPSEDVQVVPQNVVNLSPICPNGLQRINGECRDVWRVEDVDTHNVITVPPNCPPGQEFINGQCRDVWPVRVVKNTVSVPPNCPPGQELVNEQCRDIWRNQELLPPSNVAVVPRNCKIGQVYIDGRCQDIWRGVPNTDMDPTSDLLSSLDSVRFERDIDEESKALPEFDNKNIITVPNLCPSGTRPDGNGICRPLFD